MRPVRQPFFQIYPPKHQAARKRAVRFLVIFLVKQLHGIVKRIRDPAVVGMKAALAL